MSGVSATTPGNDQLLREFKDEGTRECALKSSTRTWRDLGDKGESSKLKLEKST